MHQLPSALGAMGQYRQFIVYKHQPSTKRPGKIDKFPCDFRDGRVVSAHDQSIWTDHGTAIAAATNYGANYGVGFTFAESDPFWFMDLDDAALPDGSGWKPHVLAICNALAGCAIEVSVSGKGLHIFGTGQPPAHGCESPYHIGGFYHKDRYVALTGNGAVGDCATNCEAILPLLVDTYWPARGGSDGEIAEWTSEPDPDWRGPTDDAELIRRAMRSQSVGAAFGGRASFADLWQANIEVLSRAYPDEVRAYDSSSADAALAQHLAFWTGKDCERIQRLMLQSGLARDKWEREDYLPRTIVGAVSRQLDVLTDKQVEPVASTPVPTEPVTMPKSELVQGTSYVNLEQQQELFAGCVYIEDLNKVLAPGGVLLKQEQFKVRFGGYTFTIDASNEKVTKDAWEAFTQNQALRCPKARSACFRPELPFARIIERDGQTTVNTYWPVEVPRKVGDITPFTDHLRKVLPDERDRTILLCYMAACVQHKGVKFQWAPLLQGVEGNGKTLFTRCVAEAIGERYTHFPPAHDISERFNSWLFGNVFIGVEDVFVSNNKQEVFEVLKPMITSERLAKRAMQTDQVMSNVVANFMFNSNHKDGLRKTRNDRRVCNLFSAQQHESDLGRDGMGGNYFPKLYDWLKVDGYAIVAELLHTMPIPDEFNPATHCQRAPSTTSTEAAISASTGGVEQEVMEAIGQELAGFCGSFVSSIMLERMLERKNVAGRITHSKRREMLADMGYIYHPALSDGRVNNMVLPDGGKPRLFVKAGSDAARIVGASEAAKAYEVANNGAKVPFPVR